ncbi:methylenetetrahydrofolate reduct [Vararia minispora EC-137]|uniref:Methylenetetrahydrofolate reduct n=1 Tax=Vararia minispora EC-137 TaxID=1314806 RepID=A0ACB8QKP6_9AGAM|nr:methylenetetrahydrofolate reduct [Vararia minispora EC-137]
MKFADKFASSTDHFYTFEFFPPRTDQGFNNLLPRISRLAQLRPQGVAVTWGAGGSTKDRSLELAAIAQKEYGLDTVMHLTCTNMRQGLVDEALRSAKAIGVQNIMALRGDPPRGEEYWIATDPRFKHAIDLVSYIRSSPEFSDAFSIGVAGYPDGHGDKLFTDEEEMVHLKAKVDAGADFIVTQIFYDIDNFLGWVQKLRDYGITIPILAGIMPIQTYASFQRVTKLCGTHVPPSLMQGLDLIKGDDQKVKEFGVQLSVKMVLRIAASGAVRGFHFCTLNLEKSVQRVLENVGWSPGGSCVHNKLIAESPGSVLHPSITNPDLLVSPTTATFSAMSGMGMGQAHVPGPRNVGKGEANNAGAWDEFPNGRFGDVNSPAFGSQDQWGGFSGVVPTRTAWGSPQSTEDVTTIFLRFLNSETKQFAFSSTPLSSETTLILPYLKRLAERDWWPVGSQPAVDGADSGDEIVGWGPAGGYVYQKPFVEFFAEASDVDALEDKLKRSGVNCVDFLAANAQGDFKTNISPETRNAVTWGVFPGQEIIQSTIIEQESFLTWKDEAFSTWTSWASLFPPQTREREVLDSIKKTRWLVNVTHHDFKDANALWRFLFDDDASPCNGTPVTN